jgi:hypothetical protein
MPIKHANTVVTADDGTSEVGSNEWNANHTVDTFVDLPAIATPTAPAAATMRVWAKSRAGRMFLTSMGSAGLDESYQPSLFSSYPVLFMPNTGTTVPIAWGTVWTAMNTTGAMSTPAPAVTNRYTMMRRCEFAAGAVSGQSSGITTAPPQNILGAAAGMGGFFFFARFGFTAYTSAARLFIGVTARTTSQAATEPSTWLNSVGLCKDSTDPGVSFLTRSATTPTKTGTFTPATATIYDFTMFVPANSSTFTYRVVDETNGTVIFDNLTMATTPPAASTLMAPFVSIGASSAVAQTLGLSRLYVENDF